MRAQRAWMSGTVNSNICDINSQHSHVTYHHIRCKTSFRTHPFHNIKLNSIHTNTIMNLKNDTFRTISVRIFTTHQDSVGWSKITRPRLFFGHEFSRNTRILEPKYFSSLEFSTVDGTRNHLVYNLKVWNASRLRLGPYWGRARTRTVLGQVIHSREIFYAFSLFTQNSSKCLESIEEKVVSATEMHAMEMKCCLQRLQMASYLRHKSSWSNGYSNPLVCHAVHKSTDFRPREFEIRLRYKDNSMITVQIFYKTNTECLLRILWN